MATENGWNLSMKYTSLEIAPCFKKLKILLSLPPLLGKQWHAVVKSCSGGASSSPQGDIIFLGLVFYWTWIVSLCLPAELWCWEKEREGEEGLGRPVGMQGEDRDYVVRCRGVEAGS